jgi:hypothetical protein
MVMQAPATTTDLANLALDLCEENNALLDVESDTTAAGKAIRRAFWACWDETLRAAPWNCARKRISIAALAEEPSWGYDFYYGLPGDYMNMQEIDGLTEGEQWAIEETTAGAKAIAIDLAAPLYITYTYQLRDIAKADALFKSAFVARLGAAIAPPVTKDQKIEKKCWDIYRALIGEAMGADSREGSRRPTPDSAVVSERD